MHFAWVHLTRQISNLGLIACIFKRDDVMRITSSRIEQTCTQRTSLFVFVKDILGQIYYRKVSVMTNFCKDVYHSIIRAGRQVVHHQKRSFLSIKGAHFRQSIVKFNSGNSYYIFVDIHRNNTGFVRVVG